MLIHSVASADRIEALITPVNPWVDEVVENAPNLKWIHFLSAGVDGIWNLKFDKNKYIMSKSSGVHAIPMAEFSIAGILHFLKGFHVFHKQQRNKQWSRHWLDEATGKTVAILGLGAIGKEIAKRCKRMGMRVTGVATTIRQIENVDVVVDQSDIKTVLAEADFVVICLPLTQQTKGLLNEDTLKCIKYGAYMIDISRGTTVDQTALVKLLENGRIGGAVLDVFEKEPLPTDSPLWELDNVLITPHVSGTTPHYMERAIDIFLQNRTGLMKAGSFTASALTTPVDVSRGY